MTQKSRFHFFALMGALVGCGGGPTVFQPMSDGGPTVAQPDSGPSAALDAGPTSGDAASVDSGPSTDAPMSNIARCSEAQTAPYALQPGATRDSIVRTAGEGELEDAVATVTSYSVDFAPCDSGDCVQFVYRLQLLARGATHGFEVRTDRPPALAVGDSLRVTVRGQQPVGSSPTALLILRDAAGALLAAHLRGGPDTVQDTVERFGAELGLPLSSEPECGSPELGYCGQWGLLHRLTSGGRGARAGETLVLGDPANSGRQLTIHVRALLSSIVPDDGSTVCAIFLLPVVFLDVSSSISDGCTLPFEAGDCDAAIPVYAYIDGICQAQSWGGCGGNANKFQTLEACQAACTSGCPAGEVKRVHCTMCGPTDACVEQQNICFRTCTMDAECATSSSFAVCVNQVCWRPGCF